MLDIWKRQLISAEMRPTIGITFMTLQKTSEIKQNKFIDIWNKLSHSQKNIIYKLGQIGWQLDYSKCLYGTCIVKIIHYNGNQGQVNFLGEVEFIN